MDIEELIRSTTPDFLDVDIKAYVEEQEDGRKTPLVRVEGTHDGQTYAFEMAEHDEDLPQDVKVSELNRFYSRMIEAVIEEEL